MIAFDSNKRSKAYGCYTACPCTIMMEKGIDTQDINLPDKVFKKKIEDLINQWKESCDKYSPKNRIHQNWNKAVKLPYGKFAYLNCVHDQSVTYGNFCSLSLEDTSPQYNNECQATGNEHHYVKGICEDCGLDDIRGDL